MRRHKPESVYLEDPRLLWANRDKLYLSIEVLLCHRIALHLIQREISKRLVSEASLT